VRDEKLLPWPRTPDAVRAEIAAYYGMISHLDGQIGRILRALDDTGRARDTIVVFAGDNGLAVGQHGLLGKQNLYEHSVRVPLVFRGPGIPRGRRSDALVYLFDVFPTLCALGGLEAPATVEGINLTPILSRRQVQVRDSVFGAYRDVQRMIRDDRWKAIWYPKLDRWQLFDLKRDPLEMKDLAALPKHAERLALLKSRMAAAQEQFGDVLLTRPKRPLRP
jgi:arylsulfatase A-like enzyme